MKISRIWIIILMVTFMNTMSWSQTMVKKVPEKTMQKIYEEVKTPYKYGLVLIPENNSKKVDCPSVFRKGAHWYMTYVVFNGRGYETWLAKSDDLLHWKSLGQALSFSDSTDWDANQKAGYIALQDFKWGEVINCKNMMVSIGCLILEARPRDMKREIYHWG